MSKTLHAFSDEMTQKQIANLLLSAAGGGVIGATAALLLAPKSGHRLRREIYDTYQSVSERAQDLAHDVAKKGHKAASYAANYAETVKDQASHLLPSSNEKGSYSVPLIVGAVSGAILGATAIFSLAEERKSSKEGFTDRMVHAGKAVADNFQSINWIDAAKEVVSAIQEKVTDSPHFASRELREKTENLNHVLEWASLGVRLWNNVKKGR